jgi:hypothetical protein
MQTLSKNGAFDSVFMIFVHTPDVSPWPEADLLV